MSIRKIKYYNSILIRNQVASVWAVIDSGAETSYMSLARLSAMTRYPIDTLESMLERCHSGCSVGVGGNVRSVHVHLRNCKIGNWLLPEFHTLVSAGTGSWSLLGLDFIDACRFCTDHSKAELTDFSQSIYNRNIKQYYSHPSYEILCHSQQSSAFDEYCDKLGITDRKSEEQRLLKLFGSNSLSDCDSLIRKELL